MKKKCFRSTISSNLIWDIHGATPEEIQKLLQKFMKSYPDLSNWKLEYDGGYGYDDSPTLCLTAARIETDVEFNKRKVTAVKAKIAATKRKKTLKAKLELNELKLLERLQKKYGVKK